MYVKLANWNGSEQTTRAIHDMIRHVVDSIMESGEPIAYSLCGDTLIMVTQYGEIEVYVTKVQQYGQLVEPNTEIVAL